MLTYMNCRGNSGEILKKNEKSEKKQQSSRKRHEAGIIFPYSLSTSSWVKCLPRCPLTRIMMIFAYLAGRNTLHNAFTKHLHGIFRVFSALILNNILVGLLVCNKFIYK